MEPMQPRRRPARRRVTNAAPGRLLGCIGSMEARRPLADDVSAHAYDAAFRDPRLPPVTLDDWEHIEIEGHRRQPAGIAEGAA